LTSREWTPTGSRVCGRREGALVRTYKYLTNFDYENDIVQTELIIETFLVIFTVPSFHDSESHSPATTTTTPATPPSFWLPQTTPALPPSTAPFRLFLPPKTPPCSSLPVSLPTTTTPPPTLPSPLQKFHHAHFPFLPLKNVIYSLLKAVDCDFSSNS
jgi:hypothetical protein